MRYLQPMRGVRRAELTRLDEEGEKGSDEQQQGQWVRESVAEHSSPSYK
jgi:hypothetical protein